MIHNDRTLRDASENASTGYNLNVYFSAAAIVCCAVYFCHIMYSRYFEKNKSSERIVNLEENTRLMELDEVDEISEQNERKEGVSDVSCVP